MTDSNGAVLERLKYTPHGERVELNDMSNALQAQDSLVRLGFTGQYHDDEFKLINAGHRLYDPKLLRFISPDPLIGDMYDSQAYNRYVYARNNPLTFVDLDGLTPVMANNTQSENNTAHYETVVRGTRENNTAQFETVVRGTRESTITPSQPSIATGSNDFGEKLQAKADDRSSKERSSTSSVTTPVALPQRYLGGYTDSRGASGYANGAQVISGPSYDTNDNIIQSHTGGVGLADRFQQLGFGQSELTLDNELKNMLEWLQLDPSNQSPPSSKVNLFPPIKSQEFSFSLLPNGNGSSESNNVKVELKKSDPRSQGDQGVKVVFSSGSYSLIVGFDPKKVPLKSLKFFGVELKGKW